MTTDDKDFGQLFRKGATEKVPPGLEGVIMQKIREAEVRRIYRRLLFTLTLRFVAVFLLLIFLVKAVLKQVGKMKVTEEITKISEKFYQAGPWLSGHVILILFVFILLFFIRAVTAKTDYL